MLRRGCLRWLWTVGLGFALLLTTSGLALSRSAAPAPRTLVAPKAARGPFTPFDLTYVRVQPQGLLGIRPAALIKELPPGAMTPEVRGALDFIMAYVLAQGFDCDLTAAPRPRFEDLEECLLHISMSAKAATNGENGTFTAGAGTPFVLRTVQRFDWGTSIRKWFPKAEKAHHAGRDYLRVAWKPDVLKKLVPDGKVPRHCEHMALFVPDGRTLVCGSEADIRVILQRLRDGKPAPTPPPGWRAYERDLIALAFDTRKSPLVSGVWPAADDDPPEAKHARTLIENTAVFAAGITLGDRSHLRLTALARDTAAAHKVQSTAQSLLRSAARDLKTDTQAPAILVKPLTDALSHTTVTRAGRHVHVHAALDSNLLHLLATATANGPAAGTHDE